MDTLGTHPGNLFLEALDQLKADSWSEALLWHASDALVGCADHDETPLGLVCGSPAGKEGFAEAGTWINYNGKDSIMPVSNYTIGTILRRIFVLDLVWIPGFEVKSSCMN